TIERTLICFLSFGPCTNIVRGHIRHNTTRFILGSTTTAAQHRHQAAKTTDARANGCHQVSVIILLVGHSALVILTALLLLLGVEASVGLLVLPTVAGKSLSQDAWQLVERTLGVVDCRSVQ